MEDRGAKSPLAAWYALFALAVLVMGWEANLNAAALAAPVIPEEAIRIRILANSDSPGDQWIKKQVRDAIIAEVNGWGLERADAQQARAIIMDNLPVLQRTAEQMLVRYGFAYGATAELSRVAFPPKWFAGTLYPAGEYETLLITLGAGRGENWWCVLFPPLCFAGGTVKAKEINGGKSDAGATEGEDPVDKENRFGREDGMNPNPEGETGHRPEKGKNPPATKKTISGNKEKTAAEYGKEGAGDVQKHTENGRKTAESGQQTRQAAAYETETAGGARKAAENGGEGKPADDGRHTADRGGTDNSPGGEAETADSDGGAGHTFAMRPAGPYGTGGGTEENGVEVRFFFVDLFRKAAERIKGLFA